MTKLAQHHLHHHAARLRTLGIALATVLGVGACKSGNPHMHDDIMAQMATTKPSLDSCYEVALARNRHLNGGFFTIEFLVDGATGQFKNVIVRRDEVQDPAVRQCVINAVRSLKLAQPSGSTNTEVSYAFKFVPTS